MSILFLPVLMLQYCTRDPFDSIDISKCLVVSVPEPSRTRILRLGAVGLCPYSEEAHFEMVYAFVRVHYFTMIRFHNFYGMHTSSEGGSTTKRASEQSELDTNHSHAPKL